MKKITLFLSVLIFPIVASAQFTEDFESGATIPATWTVINGGDATNTWTIVDFAASTELDAHSGTKSATIGYGATAHEDYLISPAITVTAATSDGFSFWGRSRDPEYPEVIDVKVSTTGLNAADFTETLQAGVAPPSGASFYKYSYDLTPYIGQTIYVAFFSSTTDMFYFDIDDVVNGPLPSCAEPSPFVAESITTETATLSWTTTASSVEVEYGLADFVQGTGTTVSSSESFLDLTGLEPGTEYDAYVRAKCGDDDFSEWVALSFTTEALPAENDTCETAIALTPGADYAAGALTATNVNATTSDLVPSCQANYSGDVWFTVVVPADGALTLETGAVEGSENDDTVMVAYRGTCDALEPIECDDDDSSQGLFSKLELTGLNPGETLYVGVWQYNFAFFPSTPGAFQISAYNASLATTAFQSSKLQYFPNPVNDVLNISYSENIQSVNVYNMLGQQVLTAKVDTKDAKIDVSSLATGNYVVKANTNDAVQVMKIVKK